ncbi:MAG: hypothetical protein EXR29_04095 [Betaproteobacteria bacterium]|nr:hypothetical protein [Betaproteobacteria bacterium]
MIYLIEYDRKAGTLVRLREYSSEERHLADEVRLKVELDLLSTNVAHEVVLLEASNQVEVRKTHRRYFEKLEQLLRPAPAHAA